MVAPTVTARAQDAPRTALPRFDLPLASPRVQGLTGRLMWVSEGDSRFGAEREAEVALGEDFPLIRVSGGGVPVSLGFGAQVYGRFSLSDSKSALISNDWVVGVNATTDLGRWGGTFHLYHESSHLGDEYADRFGARRVDWTREVAAAWLFYDLGRVRISTSASHALADQLGLDPWAFAWAVDYRGASEEGRAPKVRPLAGLYSEASGATRWRLSSTAKLGLAFPVPGTNREVGIALVGHDGLSTQRQFYQRRSRYLAAELRLDL